MHIPVPGWLLITLIPCSPGFQGLVLQLYHLQVLHHFIL